MYKNILCAVEASDEGREVLVKASQMAELYGSQLVMINVIPYSLLPKNYQEELEEKIVPKIESLAAEFNVKKKNRMIKFGKPYEVICQEADKREIDLIVLGTHSKKGVQSLIGSTANGVANHAKCDVSLVRVA